MSARVWNPSAITFETFDLLIPIGVPSTEGTFDTPLFVEPFVAAFEPLINEIASDDAALASTAIGL